MKKYCICRGWGEEEGRSTEVAGGDLLPPGDFEIARV